MGAPPSTETRIALLENAMQRMANTQEMLGQAMRDMVELSTKHDHQNEALNRAFTAIKSLDARLDEYDKVMPQLLETRRWVVTGVLGIATIVCIAVVGLVVYRAPAMPMYHAPVSASEIKHADS